jgi:hypothetical protein
MKQNNTLNNSASFVKTTLNTFKGARTTLKNLENVSKIKIITNTKMLQDVTKQALSGDDRLFERNSLKNYNKFFKSNALNLKFYINSIVYNNTTLFVKNLNSKLNSTTQFIKINWYNKLHNSIVDVTKNNIILYLRSSRHFNKGRYSRNRQLYRTGVY